MVIVWSERAKRDFRTLSIYTARHSPRGAGKISARILKRIADIVEMPEQGSLLPKQLRRLEMTRTPSLVDLPNQG